MADRPVPVTSDDALAAQAARTRFNISRIFRYFLLGICMSVILVLTIIFLAAIFRSRTFRDAVNNQLKDNIIGIVITSLAVIGINLDTLRK